jgi:hypothetical protein
MLLRKGISTRNWRIENCESYQPGSSIPSWKLYNTFWLQQPFSPGSLQPASRDQQTWLKNIREQKQMIRLRSYQPWASSPRINCWKSRRLHSGKPCSVNSSFSWSSSGASGSAIATCDEHQTECSEDYYIPVSMKCWAATRSSSNISGVSSGPWGSLGAAGISFNLCNQVRTDILNEQTWYRPCVLPSLVLVV